MRAAVEQGAPVPVIVTEACRVLQVIEAARHSAEERRAVTLQWPV